MKLFLLLIGMLFCTVAFGTESFVKNQLIIKISAKGAVSTAELKTLHQKIHAKAASPFKLFKQFQVVSLPEGKPMAEALKYYAASSLVDYAEPNYIYHALEFNPDPLFDRQWSLQNTGQNGGTPGADMGAKKAWEVQHGGGKKVTVAVIDTGVDYTHPDLAAVMWRNPGETGKYVDKDGIEKDRATDGIDNDGNGFVDDSYGWNFYSENQDPNYKGTNNPKDDHFHGTHCAGVIAAAHNGIGTMGIATNVQIMPVKFLGAAGNGTLEAAMQATEYAILNKADILSNSWGGDGYSRAFGEIIEEANRHGILYVAAAGNDHNNNDTQPTYPASYTNANVIAVAASDNRDEQAFFTNWGSSSVHLFAPGVKVLSTVLNQGYKAYSGTSMACPHVAGAAAVLLSELALSHLELKKRLVDTVDKPFNMKELVSSHGRLNLYNALMNIISPEPKDPGGWTEKSISDIASPHPYPPLAHLDYVISEPGAKSLKVHFSRVATENKNDFVALSNADGKVIETLTGNQGSLWSRVIPGEKVTISIRADSENQDFGFEVDRYSFSR